MDQDKSFITEFLEVYSRHPVGIEDLIKMCQGKCNGADETFVKCKINNLRTVYRKEHNKVRLSKSTGSSADDIYVPSLWYFDLMSFTAEDEIGRIGISSLDDVMEFNVSNLFSYTILCL